MSDPTLTAWWDFANQKTLASRYGLGPTLVCTRAVASKTVIGVSGLVETLAANAAGFDHDPVSLRSLGLSIEESRENKCLHGRDSTQAEWVAPNMTTAKDQVGEDGVINSASSLLADAGNATAIQSFTLGSVAQVATFSIKRLIGTGDVDITIDDGVSWNTVSINSLIYTRFPLLDTLANPAIGIRLVTSGDKVAVDYQGLEAGAFPTSRIATAASAVVRNKDEVKTTDVSWVNEAGGTFYIRASLLSLTPGSNGRMFSLNDGSTTDVIDLFNITGDVPRFLSTHSSDTDASINGTAMVAGVASEFACAYADDDFILYQDGLSQGTDIAAAVPLNDAIAEFDVGMRQNASSQHNGHIAEIRNYNVRKSNPFLASLSNGLIGEANPASMAILNRRRR